MNTQLLAIEIHFLSEWITSKRWRVYAVTGDRRVICFTMYSADEPTLETAQAHFQVNYGESLEIDNPETRYEMLKKLNVETPAYD